jgi:hypothetical protein
MNVENLISLIDKSEIPNMQKNHYRGFVLRAKEELHNAAIDKVLIEKVANEKNRFDLILSTDEVKIYKIFEPKDILYEKNPFKSIFKNSKGEWRSTHAIYPTLDTAYLGYLDYKHLGSNSQFLSFAIKMLEIKIED